MHPLEIFCCQNPSCPDVGVRGNGNLRWHGYSGHKRLIRGLFCRTCKKYFSERKGTVLEHSRLQEGTAISVLEHMREGCGVRSTARLVGVCPNTVIRLARISGKHALEVHDEKVEISPKTREVQFDEKWGFVYKKEANCSSGEEDRGDNWDHTAIDAEHRLLLSIVPGKRTSDQCDKVVEEVKKRTGDRTDLLLTSDEHAPYKTSIQKAYSVEEQCPEHTGTKKTKKMPDNLCYATVRKTRKGGRVIEVCKTLVFGVLSLLVMLLSFSTASFTINTSFVERHNATDRGQNARKARKTLRFSKNWEVHNAMTFFVAYSYNFCWPVRTLRVRNEHGRWEARTPAMSAGLAQHVWTTREWVLFPARPARSA